MSKRRSPGHAPIAEFGGDPNFIVAAGCSAGGHLATLAGLTANDPQWQAELPDDADTSVDAVVSVYGLYDWQDRSTAGTRPFMGFLERVVVKRSQARHPEVFSAASPVDRVHSLAPPFLVVHGSNDSLIPVARRARSSIGCDRCQRRRWATSSCQVSATDSIWSTEHAPDRWWPRSDDSCIRFTRIDRLPNGRGDLTPGFLTRAKPVPGVGRRPVPMS